MGKEKRKKKALEEKIMPTSVFSEEEQTGRKKMQRKKISIVENLSVRACIKQCK